MSDFSLFNVYQEFNCQESESKWMIDSAAKLLYSIMTILFIGIPLIRYKYICLIKGTGNRKKTFNGVVSGRIIFCFASGRKMSFEFSS